MSEEKPVRGRKPLEPPDDTTIGTQPWTAWVVAALGVILVVIVVFLALDRAQTTARRQAAQQSASVVGGLVVQAIPTANATASSPVVAVPAQVTATLGAIVLDNATSTPVADAPVAEEATDAPAEVAQAEATVTPAGEEPDAVETADVMDEAMEQEAAEAALEPTETAPTVTPLPSVATPAAPTSTPRAVSPLHVPAVAPVVVAPGDGLRGEANGVRLYADADPNAAVLEAAAVLAGLTVVEPSGDFEDYPILRFGHNWARVRAADGLVGWVIIDNLERVP